eukprot:gene33970-41898_t
MTRRRKSTLTVAAACTLGAGLVITAILFGAVGALEYGKMQLDFEQRANLRTAAIQRGLNEAVQVLKVTNQLFVAAAPVSRQQFHDFTAPLLQQYPFIQAFNYHRIVTLAERPAYEAEMRRTFPGFTITEHDNGVLRPAGERPSYDVVHFLEPLEGNQRAFGIDSGYNPQMPLAIDQILTTGTRRRHGGRRGDNPESAWVRGEAALPSSPYTNAQTGRCWLAGDAHLANFGAMRDAAGTEVFGVSDFDEAYIGQYLWDLRRLAVSLLLADYAKDISLAERRAAIAAMAQARYMRSMASDGACSA